MSADRKVSEKVLERRLVKKVKDAGGWAIKLLPFEVAGLPDRMVLMPLGRVYFVEMKRFNEKPSKIQNVIHRKFEALGFPVEIIDRDEKIMEFINRIWEN